MGSSWRAVLAVSVEEEEEEEDITAAEAEAVGVVMVGVYFRWISIRISSGIRKALSTPKVGLEKSEFPTYPCAFVKSQNRRGASK
jgi:hypothetical protein